VIKRGQARGDKMTRNSEEQDSRQGVATRGTKGAIATTTTGGDSDSDD
jgi:hypothetical protein